LEQEGDLSFDAATFDAETLKEPERIADACNTLPFMSPLRLVVIRDVEKANKAVSEAIISYLEAPATTTVLVLTAEKLAKNARLLKAVSAISDKAVVDAAIKKSSELPEMVCDLARDRGVTMSRDAAGELIARVGNSTIALDKQLEKLASFVFASGRRSLEREDVQALVERTAEISPWDFIEAVFSRSLPEALVLRKRLAGEKPHALMALSVMRLRELISVRSLMDQGCRDRELAAAMKRPDWQVRKLQSAAARFKAQELRTLLFTAAEYARQMKSGGDPEFVLEEFLVAVTGRS
jgi:DNA polymerase-3 subunit delta